MSHVVLVAHHERPEAIALARRAIDWLAAHGHDGGLAPPDADALRVPELAAESDVDDADLLISLGGDGTMLRAVQLIDGRDVPIIGVNVGLLGYLAEIEPPQLLHALERFFAGPEPERGDWQIDERMMLDVTLRRAHPHPEEAPTSWRALNEGVVERQDPGHTVRLAVSIDGAPFTTYAADGLIVATPTGSTAYSLSARGPVVSPRHRALLLTPVAPHTLFDRTLVLDPEERVVVEVLGHRDAALSIDGQHASRLSEGDTVEFSASATIAEFVRFGRRRFHQILKTKFGLSDR